MVYVLYAALALITFLLMLNQYLLGAWKLQMHLILIVLAVGLLGAVLWTQGWKAGVASSVAMLIFATVTRSLAARAASRILAGDQATISPFRGVPSHGLARISLDLERLTDLDVMAVDFAAGGNSLAQTLDQLFAFCWNQPSLRQILQEFVISRTELEEIYSKLLSLGAGQRCGAHWVPASAFAYPDVLRYVLIARQQGRLDEQAAYRLVVHFERRTPLESNP